MKKRPVKQENVEEEEEEEEEKTSKTIERRRGRGKGGIKNHDSNHKIKEYEEQSDPL